MSISLEAAQRVLRAQPFSELLGAEVVRFSENMVELHVPILEHLKQQYGFVHGGVISYAADNALTFAGGYALGPSVVTSEFKINYVRPAVGDVLIARASVVHAGAMQAVCRCDVSSLGRDGEVLCAVAQGTIAAISHRKGAMPVAARHDRPDRSGAVARNSRDETQAPQSVVDRVSWFRNQWTSDRA